MFYLKINTFLEKVCEQIKYKPVRKQICEELEEHLLEIKEEKANVENLAEEEAEEKAVQAMGDPEKIGKKLNKIHRPKLDWQLLVLVMILIFYGIFNIVYKTNTNTNTKDIKESIFYMIIGIGAGIVLYCYDYRKIQKFSNIIYLLATLLIILAFIPTFGATHGGIQYISIMKVMFNPTMLSVPLYIIAFADFLINIKEKKIKEYGIFNKKIYITINGKFKVIVSSIISLILVLAIPSITNAIMLGIVYGVIGIIYIWKTSNNKQKLISILSGSILVIAITLTFLISLNCLPIQKVIYSLKPENGSQNLGYVGMLQKEIIENSKLIGLADTSVILEENIVTEESNYTFIYLMGKLGILAVGILTIVIILMSIKLIVNAKLIKDMYGKIAIIGLGTLYILQSVFNILMNLNLGIQTNVNLPFVCEGGVFFIINCISIAFLLSIYRRKDIDLEMKNYEMN